MCQLLKIPGRLCQRMCELLRILDKFCQGMCQLLRIADRLFEGMCQLLRLADILCQRMCQLLRIADRLCQGLCPIFWITDMLFNTVGSTALNIVNIFQIWCFDLSKMLDVIWTGLNTSEIDNKTQLWRYSYLLVQYMYKFYIQSFHMLTTTGVMIHDATIRYISRYKPQDMVYDMIRKTR